MSQNTPDLIYSNSTHQKNIHFFLKMLSTPLLTINNECEVPIWDLGPNAPYKIVLFNFFFKSHILKIGSL